MRHLYPFALFALFSFPAFAQKVVILDVDGDGMGKLRAQIESAVKSANAVEVVPLKAFKDAAAKKKLKGAAAMTPAGIARASRLVKFDAAVGGEVVGNSYKVLIYDRAGEQLWTKELALKRGLLSDDFATKLARAITAAAEQGAARAPSVDVGGEDSGDETLVLDLTVPESGTGRGVVTGRPPSEQPAEERDSDLEDPNRRKERDRLPVPLFRAWASGMTTWRTQCVRPGVTRCKEYDATKHIGVPIDFTSDFPYLGFSLDGEVFPLARLNNRFLQGLGVVGGFQYGQSQTRIAEEGGTKNVTSLDVGFNAQLTWRFFFLMGYGEPQPLGYVGLRGGLWGRSFTIDPTAVTGVPSSERSAFPSIGIDGALPLSKFLRFEVGFSYFFSPKPSAEQIVGYGNLEDSTGGVVSSGWGLNAGVSGQIWGPLGYVVRWRYQSFIDTYYGQGQKWTLCNETQCGGVGEESFHVIFWGLSASY